MSVSEIGQRTRPFASTIVLSASQRCGLTSFSGSDFRERIAEVAPFALRFEVKVRRPDHSSNERRAH